MQNISPNQSPSVITCAFSRLRNDILSGRFSAGEKLPGERDLSQLYGIGRSSMRQVLLRLQEERYIERIPVYGTFVRKDVSRHVDQISLAFVSSDASFNPEHLGSSGWSNISEILRGIYEEVSALRGVSVTVQHFTDTEDPEILSAQLEDLCRFDGAVFCGYLLGGLKRLYAQQGKAGIVVYPKLDAVSEPFPCIGFDFEDGMQDLLSLLIHREVKPEVVLFYHEPHAVDAKEHVYIMKVLQLELKAHGISCGTQFIGRRGESCDDFVRIIEEECGDLRQFEGKVLWVLNRAMLRPLNYLLLRNGVRAEILGFSVGAVMQDFLPPIHYLLEPNSESGRMSVRLLVDQCRHQTSVRNVMLKPVLYYGARKLGQG